MKQTYKYKGVEVVIATARASDDPPERVAGWDVLIEGRVLQCATVNHNMTVLYLGDSWGSVEELQEDSADDDDCETRLDTVFAIDAGVLHGLGDGFVVRAIATGRGRYVAFDYRSLTLMEDVPLEAIHPYIDHMLALRDAYRTQRVEALIDGLVHEAGRAS